jgi:hypothetical protein
MEGVDSRDTTIVQAILELCATLDDCSERIANATATGLYELSERLATARAKADA